LDRRDDHRRDDHRGRDDEWERESISRLRSKEDKLTQREEELMALQIKLEKQQQLLSLKLEEASEVKVDKEKMEESLHKQDGDAHLLRMQMLKSEAEHAESTKDLLARVERAEKAAARAVERAEKAAMEKIEAEKAAERVSKAIADKKHAERYESGYI
jgi:hypothetical protein